MLTGRRLVDVGGNLAIALLLEAPDSNASLPMSEFKIDRWCDAFLQGCDRLAVAELVLNHCETGALRLIDDGAHHFDAWIGTARPSASVHERADWDWWSAFAAQHHQPELDRASACLAECAQLEADIAAAYRRVACAHVERMTYQLCYPEDAAICGLSLRRCRDVLEALIVRALRARDRGEPAATMSERALISVIASELGEDEAVIRDIVTGFTLDREGAAHHGAVPGVAAAPLVRLGPDRVILSRFGLLQHPLLFLARELRRRNPREYHNAAHLREDAFRQDIASLFSESRFVCSRDRIRLRRQSGTLRTDIDMAVFDRKSGALGLFELKAQDPFGRSAEELVRQRDNVLDANRQVAATLDWVNRHGADEILNRIDRRTAKLFRVRKVFPFVLGRYLVHFYDGPEPAPRAAWGTWPEVLRLVDEQERFTAGQSPIASLFARLAAGPPHLMAVEAAPRRIELDSARIVVHLSFAAFQRAAKGDY